MASFRSSDDFDRLDWEILRNGPAYLYFSREVLADDVAWFEQHEYRVHVFDCSTWTSEAVFHEQMNQAFRFPDYYGRNLIAFEECFHGIDVPDDGGVALVLTSFDAFAKRFPDEAWDVLHVIALTSRYVLLMGKRLVALIQSDDEEMPFKEIGGRSPTTNLKEAGMKLRESISENDPPV
ncbi:MAG TPA: barstar family protein [Gemmataceae bacterium]|jgi:RNAse (barnase) inhibitor barstar